MYRISFFYIFLPKYIFSVKLDDHTLFSFLRLKHGVTQTQYLKQKGKNPLIEADGKKCPG